MKKFAMTALLGLSMVGMPLLTGCDRDATTTSGTTTEHEKTTVRPNGSTETSKSKTTETPNGSTHTETHTTNP
jgi:hypothetical protein